MFREVHVVLAIGFGSMAALAGCGDGSTSGSTGEQTASAQAAAPPSDPAARVVHDFLGAVLRADDPHINACLTPLSVQRLTESNKRFPSFGSETTKFLIGEIRKQSESQTFVQCLITDVSQDGKTIQDEICCVLKLVDDQWRVSGMAFGTAQGHPTVFDFENPPQPSGPMNAPSASPPENVAAPAASRPSPPRTANETPPILNR